MSESAVQWDVAVIGAGAAGLMAAARAASAGAKTILLEKNRKAGVKILMSGGTRCNLTHDCEPCRIIEAFGPQGKFLHSALAALGPRDVVKLFNELGVATKVEVTGKVFPESDRALDVRDALWRFAERHGVCVQLGTAARGIHHGEPNGFRIPVADGEAVRTRCVIVTTGGRSYPGCGTTGEGYGWLTELGHTIVPTAPALVPLVGGTQWSHELTGLTQPDVMVAFVARPGGAKPLAKRRSSLLWTHFGFSGPAAMDVSRALVEVNSPSKPFLQIDSLPDLPLAQLDPWWDSQRKQGGARHVTTVLHQLVPQRLAAMLVSQAGIEPEQRLSELSHAARRTLNGLLKGLELPIAGTRGFEKAEVTRGGVELKEVDSRTMESRRVPGLFIAGEILDLDGWIGGYNFQSAFSTGHVAGLAAARKSLGSVAS
jgi:predicted Rossmann fold flavoprotein